MRKVILTLILVYSFSMPLCAQDGDKKDTQVYDKKNKRDPFVPLIGIVTAKDGATVDMSLSNLKFQGIVLDKNGNKIAMINNEFYKVGDNVGKFVLKNVSTNSIVLGDQTQDHTLILYEYNK